MEFSVIIPTLNEENNLPYLLADLAGQTHRDFEVIVVDGHSSDKTINRAKSFRNKLPSLKVLSSSLRNVSHQRNLGAKNARADWFLFLDADSRISKNFLEQLASLLKTKDLGVFTSACTADTNYWKDIAIAKIINSFLKTLSIFGFPGATGAFIGCKRQAFSPQTKFDEEIAVFEDGLFVRRIVASGFSFRFFSRPTFTFSMRRFRKNGHLITLLQYLKLHARQKILKHDLSTKNDYKMGGNVHCERPAKDQLMIN